MVRKGSPLANAHGAVALVKATENQGASLHLHPFCDFQPPITTVSPSAFASILKTSPSCRALVSQGMLRTTRHSLER